MIDLRKIRQAALTIALAGGMSGFALAAPNWNNSHTNESHWNDSQMSVRHAQRILKDEGFYSGHVDGMMGPHTRSALRRFQRSENLPVTGRLNRRTERTLSMRNGNANRGEASRMSNQRH